MQRAQPMETYHPSGRLNPLSIPLMLAFGGGFGLAAAFIVHMLWIWTEFYFIFLYPAAIGFAAGIGLNIGTRVGKNRNPVLSVVLGAAIGVCSYGAMHAFDSASAGAPDLLTYLNAMANEGYSLFFIPLVGPLAWLSWIVEAGVAVYITFKLAEGGASAPFCERCGQWCEDRELFSVSRGKHSDVTAAIHQQGFDLLRAFAGGLTDERDRLKVDLAYCGRCLQTGYLSLTEVTRNEKGGAEEEVVYAHVAAGPHTGKLLEDFAPQGERRLATPSSP